jgi:hypothetical protein
LPGRPPARPSQTTVVCEPSVAKLAGRIELLSQCLKPCPCVGVVTMAQYAGRHREAFTPDVMASHGMSTSWPSTHTRQSSKIHNQKSVLAPRTHATCAHERTHTYIHAYIHTPPQPQHHNTTTIAALVRAYHQGAPVWTHAKPSQGRFHVRQERLDLRPLILPSEVQSGGRAAIGHGHP